MYYPDYYLLPVPILCIISYVLYMKIKLITYLLIAIVIALTSWIWISNETGDILKILSTIIASGLAINFTLHINTRKQTQEGDNNQQSGDNSKNVKQSEGTIQQAGESNQVDNSAHNEKGLLITGSGNTVNNPNHGIDIRQVEGSVYIYNNQYLSSLTQDELYKSKQFKETAQYKNEN